MLDKVSMQSAKSLEALIKQDESIPRVKEIIPTGQEQKKDAPTKKQTEKVIESMNEILGSSQSHLKFEFHEGLGEYYVKLVDNQTNEVVREIPPKKLLDMYAAMTEFLGHLFDKKA